MSNLTYDLLRALHNKPEAVAASVTCERDCAKSGDGECLKLAVDLKRDDGRHIELLREELIRLSQASKVPYADGSEPLGGQMTVPGAY